jgi:DNA-binding response OmpR family regulator
MNVNVLTGPDKDSVGLEAEFHGRRRMKIGPNLPEGGKRILVLGVDLKTWSGLTDNLWDLGFRLDRLHSTLERFDQLNDASFDGIVWDFESSSLKGLAVVSQLRGRKSGPPVMVISSPSNKKRLVNALENGPVDFITKPIDQMELRNKCVRLFR